MTGHPTAKRQFHAQSSERQPDAVIGRYPDDVKRQRGRGVSLADGSSAGIKSSEDIDVQARASNGGWREGSLVLVLVLAPIGLAVIIMAAGLAALAAWQIAHSVSGQARPVALPAPATMRLSGMLAYAAGSWIAVAMVWISSSCRGLRHDVFIVRRLTWPALIAGIIGFVIAMYGVPVATHWLSSVTGERSQDVRIDFHDPQSIAIVIFLFVVTTPITEEILYRGLLVAWLRRSGWNNAAVLVASSLIFGANHFLPLGLVWSAAMVGLGFILCALRLRYESLVPGWLAHVLFNAQLVLSYPLMAWFAPLRCVGP
jgi:membrane protease YdiL (CAAX protease family)